MDDIPLLGIPAFTSHDNQEAPEVVQESSSEEPEDLTRDEPRSGSDEISLTQTIEACQADHSETPPTDHGTDTRLPPGVTLDRPAMTQTSTTGYDRSPDPDQPAQSSKTREQVSSWFDEMIAPLEQTAWHYVTEYPMQGINWGMTR